MGVLHHTAAAVLASALIITTIPAFAQMDFAGEWAPVQAEDNTGNPYIGEFIGLPINHAALVRSESWEASVQTLPIWQCRPHGAMYITRGPSQIRISKEIDPVTRRLTAYDMESRSTDPAEAIRFYMDGRPHPGEYAIHTWQGFSTGVWDGQMLNITTTHLKDDFYRRNGVPSSDQARLKQFLLRRGDYLTWVTLIYDPIYLTEPMIRSSDFHLNPSQEMTPNPCEAVEEVARPKGVVPSYLPGKNPFLAEFGEKYNLPMEATLGGAATMHPDLARKIVKQANEAGTKVASVSAKK